MKKVLTEIQDGTFASEFPWPDEPRAAARCLLPG